VTSARPTIRPDQRRARLGIRHHLASGHRATKVEAAATDLVGLHATDPATVHLSGWARVEGLERSTTEDALYDRRTLVRMIGMRRTMFVEPLDLAPIVHAACAPSIVPRQRRRVETMLVDADVTKAPAHWLAGVEDATLAAIERLGGGTAGELTKAVPELAIQIPIASTRVLFLLAMDGRIARGRPRGTWISSQYRWEPMSRWVAVDESPDPQREATAQADLVERWLRAFGPGTIEDIRWWSGWTLGVVRRALATLATIEVGLGEGSLGLALADDVEPDPTPPTWIAMLPSLDSTIMGWSERDWYLGDHRSSLFDRNGNAGPTIWVDGAVVGGWGQRSNGEVAIRLLEDVGAEATIAIEARAVELTAWLAGVRVMPRFPTPLQLELSA
jgi:Winged helix DNA-binding domain